MVVGLMRAARISFSNDSARPRSLAWKNRRCQDFRRRNMRLVAPIGCAVVRYEIVAFGVLVLQACSSPSVGASGRLLDQAGAPVDGADVTLLQGTEIGRASWR